MLGLPPRPDALDDERRRAHDRHRPGVVLAVLAVLALYAYLFTHAGALVGLPLPRELADRAGLQLHDVFHDAGYVASSLWMDRAHEFQNNAQEMLAFYTLLAAAFLWVYFLPVTHKRDALSLSSLIMLGVLYGWRSLGYFVAAHGASYLVFHPDRRERPWGAVFPGLAAAFALGQGLQLPILLAILPPASFFAYVWIRPILDGPRAGPILRTVAAQSVLITVLAGNALAGIFKTEGYPPLGILLFFAHWMRLIFYHVDYENGMVPKDLSWRRYMANFLCPGMLPSWFTGIESQGYAYTEGVFLSEDKNRIALGGARLMLLGLVFMALGDWFVLRLGELSNSMGIAAFRANIRNMSSYYVEEGGLGTASVLVTSFLHLLKWTLFWSGIAHFKIGVWRICGFQMAPHFNLWLASTDLLTLWRRYTFHYRQFLVSVFYYPVFFRLAHWPVKLRISIAIFASAGIGNMIWGHGCERILYEGLAFENLGHFNRRWPYFALLAAGITATYLYQMSRRSRRQPWTPGPGIVWDALCAGLTLQFYALLHVFSWASNHVTLWDRWRIFFLGLGVRV